MNCPGCGDAMAAVALEGHSGAAVTVDICGACHVLWFDSHESLSLSPASTLTLFTHIGDRHSPASARRGLPAVIRCPRCRVTLARTFDRQRDVRFEYWRCEQRHGRLITFFNFLREKNFVRPLTGKALEELRRHIQSVNCSNCGGPVDLRQTSACPHCTSPLSILDLKQAESLVTQLRDAAAPRPVDPALPLNLMRARREVEAAFAGNDPGELWWHDLAGHDLVEAGLSTIARLFKRNKEDL